MIDHGQHMAQALALAAKGLTLTSPNPRVGCVIVSADGRLLGQGHTQQAGGPHAEIMALRDAASQGFSVQGASVYVTLEPCSHQGRTGPCCDALVAAGIQKVFASITDPNPKVSGQGFERLRDPGDRIDFFKTQFRVRVQIPTEGGEFGMQFGNARKRPAIYTIARCQHHQ